MAPAWPNDFGFGYHTWSAPEFSNFVWWPHPVFDRAIFSVCFPSALSSMAFLLTCATVASKAFQSHAWWRIVSALVRMGLATLSRRADLLVVYFVAVFRSQPTVFALLRAPWMCFSLSLCVGHLSWRWWTWLASKTVRGPPSFVHRVSSLVTLVEHVPTSLGGSSAFPGQFMREAAAFSYGASATWVLPLISVKECTTLTSSANSMEGPAGYRSSGRRQVGANTLGTYLSPMRVTGAASCEPPVRGLWHDAWLDLPLCE